MKRHAAIEERAIDWLIRRDEPGWSESEQRELDAWLAESMAHKAAFWRADQGWRGADRLRSLGTQRDGTRAAATERRWWPSLVAASLVAMVGIGAYWVAPDAWPSARIANLRYDTPVGGQRTVSLVDGSKVELNTASTVRTAINGDSRDVWLDSGEAYFEVAHRDGLPFVVHAGQQRVTVLGTKFSVRRDGDRVTVNVLEGRVRVEGARNDAGRAAIIGAGDYAVARGPSTLIATKSRDHVENAIAWREGMLHFDGTALSEVAAEFNRYNRVRLELVDKEAANIRIGGTFEASNVTAFARLLRDAYGLKVEEEAEGIKISS